MQPDITPIIEKLSIAGPLVGFYDAPDPAPFAPLVVPKGRQCVFRSMADWRAGNTLHLTKEKHGCGGMHLLGLTERSREDLVAFLHGERLARLEPGKAAWPLWLGTNRLHLAGLMDRDKRGAEAAYQRQHARQGKPNAKLEVKEIDALCHPDAAGETLLKNAIAKMGLSARAYHRVLKVARTIADLAGQERIASAHIAEAIQYRRMDKTN